MSAMQRKPVFFAAAALCSFGLGAAASLALGGALQKGAAAGPGAVWGAALFLFALWGLLWALASYLARSWAALRALAGAASFLACLALYGLLYFGFLLAVPPLLLTLDGQAAGLSLTHWLGLGVQALFFPLPWVAALAWAAPQGMVRGLGVLLIHFYGWMAGLAVLEALAAPLCARVPGLPGLLLQGFLSGAVYLAGALLAAARLRRGLSPLPPAPLAAAAESAASSQEPSLV